MIQPPSHGPAIDPALPTVPSQPAAERAMRGRIERAADARDAVVAPAEEDVQR